MLGNDKTFGIAGNYVVDKDITVVSSSGTSSLGMTIGLTEENKTFEGNSTLTINGKLINGSSDNAYINLQSKGKDGENTYTSTLDLTNTTFENAQNATGVLNIFAQGANNKVVIDETINDILADTGSSGFRFAIGSGSELNINGDLEADFGAIVSAKTDGSANKIALLEGSVVKANAAELTTETETENLNLYQGTLSVADLTVSNLAKVTQASSDEKTIPDEVTMVSGSYNVSNSVTSENKVVTVGQDATLNLAADKADTAASHSAGQGLKLADGGKVNVNNGNWTITSGLNIDNGEMTVAGSVVYDPAEEELVGASFSGGSLTVGSSGKLTLGGTKSVDGKSYHTYGSATFKTIAADNADSGSIVINDGSSLTIMGDATAKVNPDDPDSALDAKHGVNYKENSIKVNGGELTLGKDATSALVSGSGEDMEVQLNQVDLTSGRVNLTYDEATAPVFTAEELQTIKQDFLGATSGQLLDGVLNVGKAGLEIKGLDDGKVAWEDFKDFADVNSDVTSAKLEKALITGVGADRDTFQGQVGAVTAATGVTELTIAQDSSLNNAAANSGNAFGLTSDGKLLDFTVNANKSLTLANGGYAGEVTLNSGSALIIDSPATETIIEGDITGTSGDLYTNGPTTVNGDISVSEVEVENGSLTTGSNGTEQGSISASYIGVYNGSLSANDITVNKELEAEGSVVTAADTLKLEDNANLEVMQSGTVKAKYLFGDTGVSIRVGIDHEEGVLNANGEQGDDTYEYSTGTIEAEVLGLNGATLYADPAFGQAASVVAVGRFDNDTTKGTNEPDAGIVNGNIVIGRNAIVGVDVSGRDELTSILSKYIDAAGSLSADNYGAIMYVGKQMQIGEGNGIVMTTQALYGEGETKGFLESDYINTTSEPNNNKVGLTANGITDGIYFGKNTGLFIDEEAFKADGSAAITFNGKDAQIVADGGDVVLMGDFRAQEQLKLFADNGNNGNADDAKKTGVDIVDTDGDLTSAEDGNGLTVRTENGLLVDTLYGANAGDVTLELSNNYRQILSGASDPVMASIVAYINGYNGDEKTEASELHSGVYTEESLKAYEVSQDKADLVEAKYYNPLLSETMNRGNGAAAESAARMAVYGGAVQVALAASQTSSDAIATRMGMGNPNSVLTFADNADGAGIWLAPVYKNHDSDGFDAQGVDYGVDMDLYGVALGADYTFAQGFRAGAMFNVGSADVDGQGAGSAVSNDADYWGVSIYGGYSYENFSVVADLGYSEADNDLDASTGMSDVTKLSASTDSSALTLGVTAQYKFELGVDVTPHVGARFTRIDVDDYSVNSNAGKVADFDADSMNVFSIPVGVAFSKEFTTGAWTVMPSVDFVVTANCGDTDFDGDTSWTGVQNLVTSTSTEVMDDVTYGVNAGLSAKYDAFSFGLGVNYTGSDNADEFGVQANARFNF